MMIVGTDGYHLRCLSYSWTYVCEWIVQIISIHKGNLEPESNRVTFLPRRILSVFGSMNTQHHRLKVSIAKLVRTIRCCAHVAAAVLWCLGYPRHETD